VALPRRRRPRNFLILAAVLTLSGVPAGVYLAKRPAPPQPLAFSEFLQHVQANKVSQVTFGRDAIDVVLADGRVAQTVAPPDFVSANSSFVMDLVARNVRVEGAPVPTPGSLSWSALATVGAFLALLGFTVYRTTAGRIPSLSARPRTAEAGEQTVTFQDVAGVDEAKDEVKEIADFLREPKRFSAVGGRIPRGVLLVDCRRSGRAVHLCQRL
jgi:cell division protease FtsH